MTRQQILVSFWVALALLAASLEPILVKFGYRSTMTPLQLLAVKSVIGAAVALPVALTGRWRGSVGSARPDAAPTWRFIGSETLARLMPVSLLLFVTNSLTLTALRYQSAVMVITIVTTTPALVALLNQLGGRDILGRRFWLGFALCCAGVVLSVEPGVDDWVKARIFAAQGRF